MFPPRPPLTERGYEYDNQEDRWRDDPRLEPGMSRDRSYGDSQHYDRYHGNTLPREEISHQHLHHHHAPPGNGRDFYDERGQGLYHPPHNRNYPQYEDDFHSMHQHYDEEY